MPDLYYRLGRVSLALGNKAEAVNFFKQARDRDALRFRADTRINEIVRQKADEFANRGATLVDGEQVIASHCAQGIAGDECLYEHVHFTFEGNYWLGLAYAETLAATMPKRLESLAVSTNTWLTREQCAQRLVLTDWDRFQGVESMLHRMEEPPFKNQSDWTVRCERWNRSLSALKPLCKPSSLLRLVDVYQKAVAEHPGDWYLTCQFRSSLPECRAGSPRHGTMETESRFNAS